ncbi:efflux RND transporter periplasmic adaptor subunit [Pseudoalteromonas sp. C2R02]|uniref:efflux RND transporter periplasmic adaptor subunit n=1 Tax=Pseudoalteromonas sp. C2R02 TaxID=2841565 RepID=UPI001C08B7AB|nr:efflux RND transporter periplasmic adaptor subunit [Pseudoalteromonas sp. C2R02]MBU2972064.1 efflux RND transporter periplasmic adaptor subunit [Pseudoalteromonas sp. C2R02]
MRRISYYLRKTPLLLIPLFLLGCDTESALKIAVETGVRPVKMMTVGGNQNNALLSFPAVIQAGRSSNLAFQVSGIVTEIKVTESQEVNKGDILAVVESTDYKVQRDVAQSEYDESESEFIRSQSLFKKSIISRMEFEGIKAKRDINKAKLESAQKALNDTVLRAPYSGNISKVDLKNNQVIQQGNPVISMLALTQLEAKINLPSKIVAKAKVENYNNPIHIVLNAAPEQDIPAFIKEVSLEADPASQTYEVTFYFEPQSGLNILPGMNARVVFQDPSQSNENLQVNIPITSITAQGDKIFVWVLDEKSMSVTKRKITLKDGIGERLQVVQGLSKGEVIITAGVSYLSEGMQVRPWVKN